VLYILGVIIGRVGQVLVGSGHGSSRVRSGWVSSLLVSGHFRFWVVLGLVGSVIGSNNVEYWVI
jgi:uncharacterized membrane protein YeaQ/YmgE (transglycosylase-associated protein family)